MKEKDVEIFEGTIIYDNEANDYYIEWVDLESDKYDLLELFEKYLGVRVGKDVKVQVKAKDGTILIIKKEGDL